MDDSSLSGQRQLECGSKGDKPSSYIPTNVDKKLALIIFMQIPHTQEGTRATIDLIILMIKKESLFDATSMAPSNP